jgi:hypothetical protein
VVCFIVVPLAKPRRLRQASRGLVQCFLRKSATIIGKVGVGLEYLQFQGIWLGHGAAFWQSDRIGAYLSATSGYNAPTAGKFLTPKLAFEIWSAATVSFESNPK